MALTQAAILSLSYPGSHALYNIWMYGGVMLSGAFLLSSYQRILKLAKTEPDYDPLGESIDVYLGSVQMFVFLMEILAANEGSEKKKE